MTVPPLPKFLIGKQVASFGFNAQDTASDGTMSNDTGTSGGVAFDLASAGLLDEAKVSFHVRHEEISPITVRLENEVIIAEGYTVDCTELIPAGGQSNVLMFLYQFDYVKLVIATDASLSGWGVHSGAKQMSLTLYCVRGDAEIKFAKGKSVATLQLKTCGIPPVLATTN